MRLTDTLTRRATTAAVPGRERRTIWGVQVAVAAAHAAAIVVALVWAISARHGTWGVGLALAAGLGAIAGLTRPAAWLSDRISRRSIIVGSQLGLGLTSLAILFLVPAGEWRAVALTSAVGASRALFDAATLGIVHHHTSDERTRGALTDLTRRHAFGHLMGLLLALPVAVIQGTGMAVLIVAAFAFAAATLGLSLHPVLDGASSDRSSLTAGMAASLRHIARRRALRLNTAADLGASAVGGAISALAFPELARSIGVTHAMVAVSGAVLVVLASRPAVMRVLRAPVARGMAIGLSFVAVAALMLAAADRTLEAVGAYALLLAGAAMCASIGRRVRSRVPAGLTAPAGLASGAMVAGVAGVGALVGGIVGSTLGIAVALAICSVLAATAALTLGVRAAALARA